MTRQQARVGRMVPGGYDVADHEQLEIINQGVSVWNRWRAENAWVKPDLFQAFLHLADLRGADLREVDLDTADLSGAELGWAQLERADLCGADLRGARASRSHLSEARLKRAHLRGADLSWTDLTRAYLVEADLGRADLSGSDLSRADLRNANLSGSDLSLADLTQADLRSADLTGANLSQTQLSQANMTGASVGNTHFAELDLSLARGLDNLTHCAPSFIDVRAVYRSGGAIPEAFLRGCGVPDDFIAFARSLAGSPIDFHSCFILYSRSDQSCAERLFADLQAKNVRCWLAPREADGDDRPWGRMDESIRQHNKLLLVLSEAALASGWVEVDVATGLAEERRSDAHILFPVRVDDCVMALDRPWAQALREQRRIYEFIRWKDHDAYQMSLACLLEDLKSETEAVEVGHD